MVNSDDVFKLADEHCVGMLRSGRDLFTQVVRTVKRSQTMGFLKQLVHDLEGEDDSTQPTQKKAAAPATRDVNYRKKQRRDNEH